MLNGVTILFSNAMCPASPINPIMQSQGAQAKAGEVEEEEANFNPVEEYFLLSLEGDFKSTRRDTVTQTNRE